MGKSSGSSAPQFVPPAPTPVMPEIDFGALMAPMMEMMGGMQQQQNMMMESMMFNTQAMMGQLQDMNTLYEPDAFDLGEQERFLAEQAEQSLTQLDKMRMGRSATILTTPALADVEPDVKRKSLLGA